MTTNGKQQAPVNLSKGVAAMQKENTSLKKLVARLETQVESAQAKLAAAKGKPAPAAKAAKAAPAKAAKAAPAKAAKAAPAAKGKAAKAAPAKAAKAAKAAPAAKSKRALDADFDI